MTPELPSLIGIDPDKLKIFENCFGGYHCVCLEKPYHIDHISQSLCNLLGFSYLELQLNFDKNHSFLVCEPDRERFMHFLNSLSETEQTLTLQYKLYKKDGNVVQVCDTATSRRMEDGRMYAFSVLSEVKPADESPSFGDIISSVIPHGYLQCTCEKFPKITYINQPLRDYLYIDNRPEPWENYAKDNIYFMLPFEERERFRLYLDEAYHSNKPVSIEHHMFRGDSSLIHLVGWVSYIHDKNEEGFAFLYRQADDSMGELKPIQKSAYFPVLKRCFNVIFDLNMESAMAELIHVLDESPISSLFGVQMTTESAIRFFMDNYILSDDVPMMRAFLKQVTDPLDNWNEQSMLQADYRVKLPDGIFRCLAFATRLDSCHVLLCCRNITNLTYEGAKEKESKTLHTFYEWLDYLTYQADDNLGVFMIDKSSEGSFLLYGSSSVLKYLGLDSEEGPHRSTQPTLDECLKAAGMTYGDWEKLISGENHYLWSRSAPNAYQFQLSCKIHQHKNRTLYYVLCKRIHLDGEDSTKEAKTGRSSNRVFARTFGHFDLFLDEKPVNFSNAKEKELMALLIDRNGGTLTPSEAITFLWEDEPVDEHVSARYRKLAMGLKRTLEKYGIEDLIINHNGVRSIDKSQLVCDYYELLAGNKKYQKAFHNSYMTDYSWSEETLAALWDYSDGES